MPSKAPPAAILLLVIMMVFACPAGAVIGGWILPVVLTVVHDGWRAIPTIPVVERIFGGEPTWLSPEAAQFVSFVNLLLGGTGLIAALAFAMRVWRFIVVKKLGWMTDRDVDEMHKRDPGF